LARSGGWESPRPAVGASRICFIRGSLTVCCHRYLMKFAGYDLGSARQRLALVVGLLFLSAGSASPAVSSNSAMPYRIRAWQTDDGLPQNPVHAITQTLDGYLWVGTREGLARFDGVRFVTLGDNAPPESLSQGPTSKHPRRPKPVQTKPSTLPPSLSPRRGPNHSPGSIARCATCSHCPGGKQKICPGSGHHMNMPARFKI